MTILKYVVQAISLLPQIIKGVNKILAYYFLEKNKELDKKAFEKVENEQDQRDLENRLFASKGGLHSGIDGTELRDHLPNVMQNSDKSGDKRDAVVEQQPDSSR